MKNIIFLLIVLKSLSCFSQQIKVAIVDFDNTSGIAKYDGLGKAMSSMLISDIEANVSPKRLQLVERSQINKILKEQSFQKTSSVDKASTVKMGKLLGVKYLLVGDIFILNDVLVINSRLVDAETGDIKFTEKKEGKFAQWLFLKTALAKDISRSLEIPFTESIVNDNNISPKDIEIGSIIKYSDAITSLDMEDLSLASKKIKLLETSDIDDIYLLKLEKQLESLKIQKAIPNFISISSNNDVSCNILDQMFNADSQVNSFANFHSGGYKMVDYFINQNLDPVEASVFLVKVNKIRNELLLPDYIKCSDYQDEVFNNILQFKIGVDNLLNSNIKISCEENIKERAIGYLLTNIKQLFRIVSNINNKNRHLILFNIYKSYYSKLVEINPNSMQLNFADNSFKIMKRDYDDFVLKFDEIVNKKE
ncbi:CsgG/HfaB family protein [Flavobacterium sp.]|jgi:TolB-like protein|uniref:CsgG/HfaB family protein n=1 Tax=Flavobacterium sp. TaxID=239 RepID=UPI0037BFAB26